MSKKLHMSFHGLDFTLNERKNGVIYADARSNGPGFKRHSLGTNSWREAKHNLPILARKLAIEHGLLSEPQKTTNPELLIHEGAQMFLENTELEASIGEISEGTPKRYNPIFEKFTGFCEKHNIRFWYQVTQKFLLKYLAHLNHQDYALRTRYMEQCTIISCQKYLIAEGFLDPQNTLKAKLKKPKQSSTHCFTDLQQQKMNLQATLHFPILVPVITTLSFTGTRISELAQMKLSDIDFEKSRIWIPDERASGGSRSTKGKESRWIPLFKPVRDCILDMPRHSDGYIFHGPKGGKFNPDVFRNYLIKHIITPLIPMFPDDKFKTARFHSFRHYFCSWCARNGVPMVELQKWMGHSASEMVAYYYHSDIDGLEDYANRMNKLIPDIVSGDTSSWGKLPYEDSENQSTEEENQD